MYQHIDILSLFHFLIYLIIGKYIKNNYKLIIFISILWELFEYFISRTVPIKDFLKKYWIVPFKYWNDSFEHSLVDISFNLLGYYIGNNYLT